MLTRRHAAARPQTAQLKELVEQFLLARAAARGAEEEGEEGEQQASMRGVRSRPPPPHPRRPAATAAAAAAAAQLYEKDGINWTSIAAKIGRSHLACLVRERPAARCAFSHRACAFDSVFDCPLAGEVVQRAGAHDERGWALGQGRAAASQCAAGGRRCGRQLASGSLFTRLRGGGAAQGRTA